LPDSYGKRQRDVVKARKAAAREDRRIARRQRHKDPGGVSTLEGDAETAFPEAPDESGPPVTEADSNGESPASGDLAGPGQDSL
jgi:hypothetical protein